MEICADGENIGILGIELETKRCISSRDKRRNYHRWVFYRKKNMNK